MMDGDIDSLDHIAATINNQSTTNVSDTNNDIYQATSFGAGGRSSQVIDPGFRAPSSLYSDPDPMLPQAVPFSTPSNATSFSDLAKKSSTYSANSIIADTLNNYGPVPSSYSSLPPLPNDPPPPLQTQPQPQQLHHSHHHHHHQPQQQQQQYYQQHQQQYPQHQQQYPQQNNHHHNQQQQQQQQPQHQPYRPPQQMPTTTHPSVPQAVNQPYQNPTIIVNSAPVRVQPPSIITLPPVSQPSQVHVRHEPQKQQSLQPSPPIAPSPPLDQLMTTGRVQNVSTNNKNNGNNSTTNKPPPPAPSNAPLGKIPKKSNINVIDEYDEFGMADLMGLWNSTVSKKSYAVRRRDDLEKAINDKMRNCQGKNIEQDSEFISLKDKQRQIKDEVDEINAKLKKIQDKLRLKYNHHVSEPSQGRQQINLPPSKPTQIIAPRSYMQRARMSTSRPQPSSPPPSHHRREEDKSKDSDKNRKLLTLNSKNVWCRSCDIHFETFKEYCDHLHKRDHIKNMKRTDPPWRKNKESFDPVESYDLIKSICSKVSHERNCQEFRLVNYHKLLNPGENREKFRDLEKIRSRRDIPENDALFAIKGYQNIIPVSGYFCQLCDYTACDAVAIEQHVKSYDHNYKHALVAASDPHSEITFRQMQEKSHKKQYSSSRDRDDDNSVQPRASTSTANPAKIPQYKKATSHIVDEHEVIKDKFEHCPVPNKDKLDRPVSRQGKIFTKLRSESPDVSRRNDMPEIVPIGESRSRPSALKQLKNPPPPPKRRVERALVARVLDNEREEEEEEEEEDGEETEEDRITDYDKMREEMRRNREKSSGVVEPKRKTTLKRKKKAYFSTDSESTDNEVEILEERHLFVGDPDSPWPHLDLKITGNLSWQLLKDPRLAMTPRVVMNRINLEDYKHMLNDSSSLWSRISLMTAKKEGALDKLKEVLRGPAVVAKKTYFNAQGESLPVELDDDDDKGTKSEQKKKTKRKKNGNGCLSDSDSDDKEQIRNQIDDLLLRGVGKEEDAAAAAEEGAKKNGGGAIAPPASSAAGAADPEVLSNASDNDPNFQMSLLENFFCEKDS